MDKLKKEFTNESREEIIDSAILKNISGGSDAKDGGGNGTAKCCSNNWKESCGTKHGDWCGHFEDSTPEAPEIPA